MQEVQVRFLSWEDSLEEEMTIHFSILTREIPLDRGAWWATVHGVTKSRTRLSDFTTIEYLFKPGRDGYYFYTLTVDIE